MKDKIFISHSAKDLKHIQSFVDDVLKLGLDIPQSRIFCSSIEGQGIIAGEYIPDRLHNEINNACLALLFISKNYRSSEVCLNESGAAWALLPKTSVIPILLPDVDFAEIGLLNLNRIGLKANKREDMLRLQ